jgi:thiol-disulfide isomerase/thioredoxin
LFIETRGASLKNQTILATVIKIMKVFFFVLFGMVQISLSAQVSEYDNFDDFAIDHLNKDNDTTYVVNFWATWCRPCVKELPLFDSLTKEFKNEPVKVVLVSLDFKGETVNQFIEKKNVLSEVVILTDGNSNRWINLIDPNWSGAIPYTLIWKGSDVGNFEKSYHNYQELRNDVLLIIKP